MKQRKTRGGTVDGIRRETLIELAALIGVTDYALSKQIRSYGTVFTYHGHHVVMDSAARSRVRRGEYIAETEPVVRRSPIDPLEIIRKARRNYDTMGQSRHGLLMRRAR